jgi:hypothetical protein
MQHARAAEVEGDEPYGLTINGCSVLTVGSSHLRPPFCWVYAVADKPHLVF